MIGGEDFNFESGSSCYSATKFDVPKIESLSLSDYTCRVLPESPNIIEMKVKKGPFLSRNALRISAKIKNPKRVVQ